MSELDIGEVMRRSGLPASTLRFYEEKGLIEPVGRRGQRRQFDAAVLERLALIAIARSAGFSLDEIARMFTPDGRPQLDRRQLADKADELDATIRELTSMRDALRHAAACPAPSHMECPTFRRLLRAAASGAIRPPRRRSGVPAGLRRGSVATRGETGSRRGVLARRDDQLDQFRGAIRAGGGLRATVEELRDEWA